MLRSRVCKFDDFSLEWYKEQELSLRIREVYEGHSARDFDFVNRKFWEWGFIAQVLEERNMLRIGRRGLGFAVGTEPLASHFASRGVHVLATDLAAELASDGWTGTGQHAAAKDALFYPPLVNPTVFDARVEFKPADMRTLEGISGEFDFIWSSCALEHLGSLRAGMDFVQNSLRFLKPGGVAVHTTELNVRSNDETVEFEDCVAYRRKDIDALRQDVTDAGYVMATPDYYSGSHKHDLEFDTSPYMENGIPHIKLEIYGHVCTSMLLVIEKPALAS